MQRSFNNYHFKGQKSGENILLVVHRHWFDILTQFIIIAAMIIVLIGSYFIIPFIFPEIQEAVGDNFLLFLETLFLLFIWIGFFIIFIDYYFDVWIVTNERVVNIIQKGLFSRVVSELELENIQDITTDVRGLIPTFLNYGNLFIQTAGERERFIFRNVPNPYAIKDLIMNLQEEYEKKEGKELGQIIQKQIRDGKFVS